MYTKETETEIYLWLTLFNRIVELIVAIAARTCIFSVVWKCIKLYIDTKTDAIPDATSIYWLKWLLIVGMVLILMEIADNLRHIDRNTRK